MKPEIKVGQVWYDNELNYLFLICEDTIVCSKKDEWNFDPCGIIEDDNWHYIGEL